MIYTFIKQLALISILLIFFGSCNNKPKSSEFIKKDPGYWQKLISFTNDSNALPKGYAAWVNAVFATQDDSVFYDTKNDLRDRFFVKIDRSAKDNFLKRAVSGFTEGDSVCILIKPKTFFEQQFKSAVPFFSVNDTVVKVYFKVKKLLTEQEFNSVSEQFIQTEAEEIQAFFGSAADLEKARDPLGFYWVQRPDSSSGKQIASGEQINISYSGGFLNGRIIDVSPADFQLVYGTPDQLLKGLNNVIGRLKIGQTSKIILPSQLAFGEMGSSNGSVPPYTPMLYKISITDKN